ncbi:hypothetical protein OFN55_34200, partial [Escherichia coli]|nr:hypothetical protein [Escherichia coli]
VHSAEFHAVQPVEVLFSTFFSSENGERGRNLLRGREALPAQPEKPFSARAGGPGRGGGCTNSSEVRSDVKMM